MKGELKYTVESQDAETGINKLIDTMKKQHVRNFTMHQELMAALQTKIHMDTWRDQLLGRTKAASAPLAAEHQDIVADLKLTWKAFNEMLQANKLKVVAKGEDSIGAAKQLKDLLHRIEMAWVKVERSSARMVKTFSTLTQTDATALYHSNTPVR